MSKSLEMISGMIQNKKQPNLAAKTVANEKRSLKAMKRFAFAGSVLTFDSLEDYL